MNLDSKEGVLSLTRTLSATSFSTIMDVEEGFGGSPTSGPSPRACEITVGVLLRFGNTGRKYKIIQSTSIQNGGSRILKTFRG